MIANTNSNMDAKPWKGFVFVKGMLCTYLTRVFTMCTGAWKPVETDFGKIADPRRCCEEPVLSSASEREASWSVVRAPADYDICHVLQGRSTEQSQLRYQLRREISSGAQWL